MNKFKKALAAISAAAMMFTMSGCSDTRYVMTYNGGEKVNAGVYIYNLYSEMSYELTMSYYSTGQAIIDLDSDRDGKKLRDYLVEQARKDTKECVAITHKFNELGLELTDEELQSINDNIKSIWDASGDLMEEEGISKESVRTVLKAQTMRTRLFDYYYAADGKEAVTDDDLKKYVEDNYVRYKAIRISKSYAEDAEEAEKENKENEATRDEFLAKAEGLSYDEFDALIKEYNEYAQAKLDAETSAEEDSAAEEDNIVGPMPSDDTAAAVDAPEDESTAEDAGLEETEASDESAETVEADDLATDSEDDAENSNDTMYDLGQEDAKESDTGKLAAFINGLEIGKAAAYDDDGFYYIVIKGDVTENSAKYATDNRETLVNNMKGDEFQGKIDSWVEEIDIKENADAIKKYTAQVVYDKQNDFYNK
ncbi:MAG: hypothetical protein J5582_08090 [Ruminococcus sp.]|uniref:hypothetical protein n=1 Tax=Ruminococcus sp. TaxID=41978 RepID=UPI0025D91A53|nr:hypothetical protein [Ruminococcus sp.]MBO4866516.1 hypothetical protein [Ruminococcus sp.]